MAEDKSGVVEGVAASSGSLSANNVHESYKAICGRLDHEAKVSSDRVTWAVSLTGGLFTATTILITIIVLGKPPAKTIGFLLGIMAVIALVGLITSSIAAFAVQGAYRQFSYLRQQYQEQERDFMRLKLPRPTGDDDAHDWAKIVALAFPVVLILCWSALLLIAGGLSISITTDIQIDQVYKLWPTLKGGETVIEPSFLQYSGPI